MGQFHYDKLNDFGTIDAGGDFPNILDLGGATAERMTVDLKFPEGPIDTSGLQLVVKTSDMEDGNYDTVARTGTLYLEDIGDGKFGLPVPKNHKRFLTAGINGSFRGSIQAVINPYLGK